MTTFTTERPVLVGNRLVLVGSVLYLLEWVALILSGASSASGEPGLRATP